MSIPQSDTRSGEPDEPSPQTPADHLASTLVSHTPILNATHGGVKFFGTLRERFMDAAISLASHLLFVDQLNELHKTKFTFSQINEQYKESIKTLDSALWWGFGVVIFCWYVFILLPDNGTIPVLGLPLSKSAWLNVSPAILLAMQVFSLIAIMRIMILRVGIGILLEKVDQKDLRKGEVGDTSNINLAGFLGMLIMLLRFTSAFWDESMRLFNLASLILLGLIALVLIAPQITLWLIIVWLLINGYYVSAFVYLILTVIIGITSLFLVVATAWLYSAAGQGRKAAAPPVRRGRG